MNYVTKLNFQKSRAQATAHDCDTCVTLPTTNALLHTLETPGFHEWAHDYTLLMLVTQELTLLKGVLFTRFLRGGGDFISAVDTPFNLHPNEGVEKCTAFAW